MTLICCAKLLVQGNPGLLMATDSMLSAGHHWPSGPKLFPVFGRGDCVLAFEGETELAYPLLFNALNFIRYSDHLDQQAETDPGSVAMRVAKDMDAAYQGLLADDYFTHGEWNCSFLLVGWNQREHKPLAWRISEDSSCHLLASDLDEPSVSGPNWQEHGFLFAGSGDHDPVKSATEVYFQADQHDPLRAYHAFLTVLDDRKETAVGGMPQIALITAAGCEVIGVIEGKYRYLLGHRVASGAQGVRYYRRDLSDLPLFSP